MVVRCCAVIMRNFCWHDANLRNIVLFDCYSKFFFLRCLKIIENRIPVLTLRHNCVAIRPPINHSGFDIVSAVVFAVAIPRHVSGIDFHYIIQIAKVTGIIQGNKLIRVFQIIDLRPFLIRCSIGLNHLDGEGFGVSPSVGVRDRCKARFYASYFCLPTKVVIFFNRGNARIARFPVVPSAESASQINGFTHRYGVDIRRRFNQACGVHHLILLGFLELCSISLVRCHIGIVGGPASEGVFHITVGLFNRGFGGLCIFHLIFTGALGKCFGKDRFALAHPSYGKLGFAFGLLTFGVFGSVRDTVFRRVSRRLLRRRLFIVGRGSGLIRHGGTGLGLLSLIGLGLIGFILSGLSLIVLSLLRLSLIVFRLHSLGLSFLILVDIHLCDISFFALVFVALALCADRDAFGVLYEIIGQNAGGEHGKHHGNGKDHCNDSFFHRFFLLFFQIFSTLAGG